MGEIYGIQPFGNQLIKVNLTGQDIRDILNQQWQKDITRMLQISGSNTLGMRTSPMEKK